MKTVQSVLRTIGTSYKPILISAIVVFIAGCINYEQKTTLNMDGSGTAQIHYWASEDVVTFLSDGPLVFDETKVQQRFAGEGITLNDVSIEMNEEDSTRHVRVDLAFNNIEELATTPAFEDVDITWKPSGDMMKFMQEIKSGKDGGNFGMDEFTITYIYNMPGDIISSNATDHNGRTLTWKYKLSDLSGEGVVLSATIESGGTLGDYAVTIAIIVGVLLLLVILFVAMKKKPQTGSAAEYSTTSEAPPVDKPAVESPSDLGEQAADESKQDLDEEKTE